MQKILFRFPRSCHSRKAFSLAETIIALLILSIALLAIAAVPIMSTKMALNTTQREQAIFLAARELNVLEADIRISLHNVRSEDADFPGFFLESRKIGGKGIVVVDWGSVVGGQASFSLERNLSRFSSVTRRE